MTGLVFSQTQSLFITTSKVPQEADSNTMVYVCPPSIPAATKVFPSKRKLPISDCTTCKSAPESSSVKSKVSELKSQSSN